MPVNPNPNYSKAAVAMLPNMVNMPEFRDQGTLFAPTIRAFRSRNAIREETGGEPVLMSLRYARQMVVRVKNPLSSTFLDFTAGTDRGDTEADFLTDAQYYWDSWYTRLVISEAQMNRLRNNLQGSRAYVSELTRGLWASVFKSMNDAMWAYQPGMSNIDKDTDGDFRLASLFHIIDAPAPSSLTTGGANRYFPYDSNSPTSQTFGGITRSATQNTFWNATGFFQLNSGGTATQPASISYPLVWTPILQISSLTGYEPDLAFFSLYTYASLLGKGIAQQDFINVTTKSEMQLGFSAIRIGNTMAVLEPALNDIGGPGASDGSSTSKPSYIKYVNTESLYPYVDRNPSTVLKQVAGGDVEKGGLPHPANIWVSWGFYGLGSKSNKEQGFVYPVYQ